MKIKPIRKLKLTMRERKRERDESNNRKRERNLCSALSCAAKKCYTVLQASSYPKPGDKTTMYERKREKKQTRESHIVTKKTKENITKKKL